MKPLKFRRLKPTALPKDPDVLDYLEYGLQWLTSWMVVDIEGHPMISGLCTGLLMALPFCVITIVWGPGWASHAK